MARATGDPDECGTRREDRPPAVLILVQNLSVPTDRRVWSESLALVDAGYTVSVICPRGGDEPGYRVLEGVHVHTYPPPPSRPGLLSYVYEFLYCWVCTAVLSVRVLRRHGFDALQACNPPDTYWLLARVYRLLGKRFVYDQHDLCPEIFRVRFGRDGGPLLVALHWLERRTYRAAHHVISPNESYREIALHRGGRSGEDITIVRSAPDPAVMRPRSAEPALKQGREHLACYLGIMGPQDGVDRLIRIVDYYVHRLGRTDCHVALLGFGDCEQELRRQCSDLGLDDWITFTGRADAAVISRYLSTADVGITPDPKNCFNDVSTMNKTLEYMSFQLPVLATDLLETRRSTGGQAVLVSEDDDACFATALAALLDDPRRRAELGLAGRRRIVTQMSWALQARAYVGVYDQLLGRESADVVLPGDEVVPVPSPRAEDSAIVLAPVPGIPAQAQPAAAADPVPSRQVPPQP
jgi:glycosyltransferase involved in cell wall biosynthesis